MRKYDSNKPLISIHIPKCAGSSFAAVLRSWFGKGFLKHYPRERIGWRLRKHNLYRGIVHRRFRPGLCIHGHFNRARGNGAEQYYPEVDQFITVIRDPFELHLSTYFYVRREALQSGVGAWRSGKRHPIVANEWDLPDYLRECERSYLPDFFPAGMSAANCQQVLDERFLFIGLAEQLQAAVDRLAGILGFESMPVSRENISQWSEPVPEGARERFMERNPLAFRIYDYVLERFR